MNIYLVYTPTSVSIIPETSTNAAGVERLRKLGCTVVLVSVGG